VDEEAAEDAQVASPVGAVALSWDSLAFANEAEGIAARAIEARAIEARAIGASVAEEPTGSLREVRPIESAKPDSLDERFASLAPAVARLCAQLLGDRDAAGDAVAEVFLRARRGWDGYDREQSFRAWLLAIASHYCIDLLRRKHREQRIFEPVSGEAEAAAAPGPSPLRRLLEVEQRRELEAAVAALPPRYRAPLVLRFHAELSYDEIAARLGLERGHVGTLLLRARRQLRDALAGKERS